jgi:polyisoprenoid-binding protein YceI
MKRVESWPRRALSLPVLIAALLLAAAPWSDARAGEAEAGTTPPGEITFVGRNWFAKANGVFHDWRIVEASVDPDRIEESWALVEVALDSVDTGIERRDEHLRTEDFFETATWPVSRVRVHSPRRMPVDPDADDDDETPDGDRYAVQFDVDLHGVQRTVEGEVVLVGRAPTVFSGSLVLDRTAFGVGPKANRWNPITPGAEIPVHFRIELP